MVRHDHDHLTADAVVHRCHHHQQENKNIINIEIGISIMFYHVLRSPLPWRKSQVLGPQSNRIITAKGDHVSWLTRLPGISGEKQPSSERRCLDWFPFVVIWFVWIVIIVIKHFAENDRFWVASCKVENGTGLWTLQFCDTSQTSQHQMHQTHPTCEQLWTCLVWNSDSDFFVFHRVPCPLWARWFAGDDLRASHIDLAYGASRQLQLHCNCMDCTWSFCHPELTVVCSTKIPILVQQRSLVILKLKHFLQGPASIGWQPWQMKCQGKVFRVRMLWLPWNVFEMSFKFPEISGHVSCSHMSRSWLTWLIQVFHK